MKKHYIFGIIILLIFICLILISILTQPITYPEINHHELIPTDIQKMTPELDNFPPILHSDEFETPVPLAIINTAGAEDSPFIPRDRDEIYFVFVKDVREPVEVQIRDPANGIWRSKKVNGAWQEPELVWLQNPKELALNGCTFVEGSIMIFCSARQGYTGLNWFTAERNENDHWEFDKKIEFPEEWEVGELHEHDNKLYYGSFAPGGKGGQDIWMIERQNNGSWSNPINIEAVNSPDNEGYPYITPDGNEMYINKWYQGSPAVARSKKVNGEWQPVEIIVSQFAGEPTLDKEGNLYFVHHYYQDGKMIEADIYVAYRK